MPNPNIKAKQQEKQRDTELRKREIAVIHNRPIYSPDSPKQKGATTSPHSI